MAANNQWRLEIFVSYDSEDQAIAKWVTGKFEQLGHTCWLFQKDLSPGNTISDDIRDSIERCNVFLVLLSPNSIKNSNVIVEIGAAYQVRKRFIPLVFGMTVEECVRQSPFLLADMNLVSLNGLDDFLMTWNPDSFVDAR